MNRRITLKEEIEGLEREVIEKKRHLANLYRGRDPEPIDDYEFVHFDDEPTTLSKFFGDNEDLIVVHNMGSECRYCTIWADGFNGLLLHFNDKAVFVACSPDPPAIQIKIAKNCGWSFPIVTQSGSTFTEEMGFFENFYLPGFSTFHKSNYGSIMLIAKRNFRPYDDFCSVWHFFDVLKFGVDGWQPKLEY